MGQIFTVQCRWTWHYKSLLQQEFESHFHQSGERAELVADYYQQCCSNYVLGEMML